MVRANEGTSASRQVSDLGSLSHDAALVRSPASNSSRVHSLLSVLSRFSVRRYARPVLVAEQAGALPLLVAAQAGALLLVRALSPFLHLAASPG